MLSRREVGVPPWNKQHTHVADFGDLFFSGCLLLLASGYQEWIESRISGSEHTYAARHSE